MEAGMTLWTRLQEGWFKEQDVHRVTRTSLADSGVQTMTVKARTVEPKDGEGKLAGVKLDLDAMVLAAGAAAAEADAGLLVVEGVGGLLVPLTRHRTVRDLAVALGFPVVIAARPGLGTINHTLLTLEAARAAGLAVTGVVITPWPGDPSVMERSNRETIARLGAVEVAALPPLPDGSPGSLAAGGAALPLAGWLA
jgi:dethiobiotin synthetase